MESKDCIGKGTAMLVSKSMARYCQKVFRLNGRGTVIVLTSKREVWIIGTIYAPASEKEGHKKEANKLEAKLKDILTKQYEGKKCYVVLGGDWNCVNDAFLDANP